MGMYTALSLGIELKKDAPVTVIRTIERMLGHNPILTEPPDHPLFKRERATWMLTCDSFYFDWQTGWRFELNEISESWYLSGVCNLKNYNDEIDLFLDWITPYIETTGYIGWKMYEEDELPTILSMRNDNGKKEWQIEELHPSHLLGDYDRGVRDGQKKVADQIRNLLL